MGRKRIDERLKKETVFVRLPRYIIEKIKKEGNPRKIIERIITQMYSKKD